LPSSIRFAEDKKPTASDILVYTVSKYENRLKVVKFSIAELWSQGYKIRINNINDKSKHINNEKEIKSQVFLRNLWHR
jgi:hypothetical protein